MRPGVVIPLALCILAALAPSAAAGNDSDLPRPDVTPAQQRILEQLIEQIQTEARQTLTDQKIASAEPDFASRFNETVEPETIGIIILLRTNRDPFIDAYTRWQLLSFEPVLPELTARQFYTVMQNTPA